MVGNLDADRRLAGDAIDEDRFGFHRQAEVFGEAGDLGVLHSRIRLEFVGGDDGPWMDLDDGTLDGELATLLFEEPRAQQLS